MANQYTDDLKSQPYSHTHVGSDKLSRNQFDIGIGQGKNYLLIIGIKVAYR